MESENITSHCQQNGTWRYSDATADRRTELRMPDDVGRQTGAPEVVTRTARDPRPAALSHAATSEKPLTGRRVSEPLRLSASPT